MEIKKNKNVDLEQGRFRMYMISLIVVLSALFVALEYNSGDNEDDVEDYDELTEEMELAPLKREEDRIALAIKQQPKPAADKIKVVEKIKELNRMDMPEEKKDEAEGKDSENDSEKQEKEKENPLFATADNALDNNPLNFRIVEDLPQFPGGAVIVPTYDQPDLDNEALRVMRIMPKWKPGVQNGKPCRTMVCIPIVFKL